MKKQTERGKKGEEEEEVRSEKRSNEERVKSNIFEEFEFLW
jgi:hypothetical protein